MSAKRAEEPGVRATKLSAGAAAGFAAEKAAGNAALRAGRYARAVTHYNAAEELDPTSALAPANRALAHLKLGDFAAAAGDASVALALQDAAPRAARDDALRVKLLLRRGAARAAMHMHVAAAADYAAALAVQPGHRDAQAALRELRERHGAEPPRRPAPPRVQVVADAPARPSAGVGDARRNPAPRAAHGMQQVLVDEFPLMRISDKVFSGLAQKWAAAPPVDGFEFERAWKSLRGDESARARYLVRVGEARIRAGLFGHSLTAQMLHEFVVALLKGAEGDEGFCADAAQVLRALTRVPRFEIATLLMSAEERGDVEELVAKFERDGVAPDVVQELKGAFGL